MSKFKVGDRVRAVAGSKYNDENKFTGAEGAVIKLVEPYVDVRFDTARGIYSKALFCDDELELLIESKHVDVTGREINIGDTIVYFTRKGSHLWSQKARVESIGVKRSTGPHILVKREDAIEKDRFTRKAWLWSFDNSVKIS